MIRQIKVKRYWPGKAPEWAEGADEEGDAGFASAVALEKALVRKDDRRLRHLGESRIDNRDEIRADHRCIRQAEIVSTQDEEHRRNEGWDAEEEDDDALEERRRRIREKLLQRVQEETALLEEEEEEEVEEEEESECETDSKEVVKPVYVPKSERDTIAERERLEAEKCAIEEDEKRKLEHRRVETKQLVLEKIREGKEIRTNMKLEASEVNVDTDDEVNEAEVYEAWKAREITRIKRDIEEGEAMISKKEIKKVRIMTEEERQEYQSKNPKPAPPPNEKWNFMQKYFHKGAFFQSDADDPTATVGTDDVYHRDFSAPTGEDKMDKTILPKVMQVKHFGRSGQTKWTHLVNEDTTHWNYLNLYVL